MKFYGKIPDILVLITGHFGLFKTPTLRLGETGRTQTQSQTRQLNISKIDFKSVRKTIASFSRQPGEFFLLLGQELASIPFLMPVSKVRLLVNY